MLLTENLCNYHLWTSFFIFLSTTNLLFSIGFGLLTFYLRNYQIFNQQIFYLISSVASILLVVQSVDSLGLYNILDKVAIYFLGNLSTWITLTLMAYFFMNLIKVVSFDDLINWKLLGVWIGIGISFILTLVSSILQSENPSLWRGIKLITFAVTLLGLTLGCDYYFYKILKIFDRVGIENTKKFYIFVSIYHILIAFIITIQMIIGINSFSDSVSEFNIVSWDNIILTTLHLITLFITNIFFLGKIHLTFE
jgi:hypothetical protein